MYDDYLTHYGVKGMRWGIRKKVEKISSDFKNKEIHLTDRQKTAIKIGAAVTASALAIYGGYKFNQWANLKNTQLATRAGQDFANTFAEQIRPKVMRGGRPQDHHRFARAQDFARGAGNELAPMVFQKVNSQTGIQKFKNAFGEAAIQRGEKTVYDVVDYKKTVVDIMEEHNVMRKGQSLFAAYVHDTLNFGGDMPRELLDELKKRYQIP